MDRRDMAIRVREAAERGLYVVLREGSDAQICGRILDVTVKMTKDGIGGEYLGWCSYSRKAELEKIVAEHSPHSWRQKLQGVKPRSPQIADEIGVLLQRYSRLEADRLSMDPEHFTNELADVRRNLERLHAQALEVH